MFTIEDLLSKGSCSIHHELAALWLYDLQTSPARFGHKLYLVSSHKTLLQKFDSKSFKFIEIEGILSRFIFWKLHNYIQNCNTYTVVMHCRKILSFHARFFGVFLPDFSSIIMINILWHSDYLPHISRISLTLRVLLKRKEREREREVTKF